MLDDEKKEKKKKNVRMKKKEDKEEREIIAANEQIEKEIEEFKINIRNQTKHANFIKKIKPIFTGSWIENISK